MTACTPKPTPGRGVCTGADAVQALLATTIGPEFGRRSQLQKTLPGDPDARWAAMRQEPLWIVVLPDLTDLLQTANASGPLLPGCTSEPYQPRCGQPHCVCGSA